MLSSLKIELANKIELVLVASHVKGIFFKAGNIDYLLLKQVTSAKQ